MLPPFRLLLAVIDEIRELYNLIVTLVKSVERSFTVSGSHAAVPLSAIATDQC